MSSKEVATAAVAAVGGVCLGIALFYGCAYGLIVGLSSPHMTDEEV